MKLVNEGLNLPKKQQTAIIDLGDHYLINDNILIGEIEKTMETWNGEASKLEISEYDNNAFNCDVYFPEDLNVDQLSSALQYQISNLMRGYYNPIVDCDYIDTEEGGGHMFSIHCVFDKPLRGTDYVEESILSYKKPLTQYVFRHRRRLREDLIGKRKIHNAVVDNIFKQKPPQIAETLLSILKPQTIKSILQEGPFKCSIDDVEKKAKKIIFVKYNWNPKNIVFQTEDDAVQITAMDDLRVELQTTANDDVLFKFLSSLSTAYTNDLNGEFIGFCGKFKFLSSLKTRVTSSVYCYAVIQRPDGFYFFSSNGEKKKLKRGNNPQYTVNKLYYKIGLFANNVKTEGLNLPKKQLSPPQSWFKSKLNQTTGPYTTPELPNSLFYTLNGEIIFEYDQKSGNFWVDYDTIWLVFEDRFGMGIGEIRDLIKSMVEEHYHLGSVTPFWKPNHFNTRWDNITNWNQNIVNEGLNLPKKQFSPPQSWFQSILDRTTGPHTTPDYPNSLFYKLDGNIIFEYDQENGDFWVDSEVIWLVFRDRFGMEYDDIQELIKPMVEDHYNLGNVTPMYSLDLLDWRNNITNWDQ